jgi:glucose/arabinose dehydrogenase
MTRHTTRTALGGALLMLASGLVAVAASPAPAAPAAPAVVALHDGDAAMLPTGFTDKVAIGNLSEPTAVAFAPDGTAFIGLKTGVIKSFDYNAGNATYEPFGQETNFADLATTVHNYWDRGLTGVAVDPQFPTRPYIYVNYTYNRDPRDNPPDVPKWSTNPGQQYDDCPTPAASPSSTGCLTMVRVSRLTAQLGPQGWVMTGPEKELVAGACFQFGSHASGGLRIGPDGMLYASVGDGASFDFEDHGQVNNPCPGDPADEGGSLRSQDLRTTGDALGIGGSIIRVNPDTGAAYDGSNDNAKRIVAYGQRNPWRLTFRPGTTQMWSADVGGSAWEEINQVQVPSSASAPTTPVNRGWPCYEGTPTGSVRNAGWDALDLPICETLYAAGPGAVVPPYFGYQTRGPLLTPGEHCESSTSSVSGVAFAPTSSNWPAGYQDSLFFSDYARSCVWRLGKKPNGEPDPSTVIPFVQAASTPVELVAGPGGDLFYVDYGLDASGVPEPGAGGIHRIRYQDPAPVAAIAANRISGPLSAPYSFSAAGSTDPNGLALSYQWDLNGDGQYDDATGPSASRTYGAPVNVTVGVRVENTGGQASTASITIYPGNDPPTITALSPTSSLRWRVGQVVPFSARASDPQDGVLGASAFDWSVSIRHCPDVCHTHPLEQFPDEPAGSFRTPDHEFPSHLLLTLSLTDSRGMPVRRTLRLDPDSVKVNFATSPAKLELTAAGTAGKAPFAKRFIVRSRFIVSAPTRQKRQGVTYRFSGWSDKGASSHEIVAPKHQRTVTATYRATKAQLRVTSTPAELRFQVNGSTSKGSFTDDLRIGTRVWVAAPTAQTRKGKRWVFVRWSDGGRRVHRIVVGPRRIDLQAVYRRVR